MLSHAFDLALFYSCTQLEHAIDAPDSLQALPGLEVLSCLAIFHTICFSGQNICTNVTSNSGCNQQRPRSLWRAWRGPKRKAADISRTQYEVYLFSTKHNLFEAAVDELLEMLSNVCTSFDQSQSKAGPATCEFEWSSEYDLYCKLLLSNVLLLHIFTWPVITCYYRCDVMCSNKA